MFIIVVKDNGDTETISLTDTQAADVAGVLMNDERCHVSNIGCYLQPYGAYRSGATGTVRETRS